MLKFDGYGVLPSVTPGVEIAPGATLMLVGVADVPRLSAMGFIVHTVIKRACVEVREVSVKSSYSGQYGLSDTMTLGKGTFPAEEVLFLMEREKDTAESALVQEVRDLNAKLVEGSALYDESVKEKKAIADKLAEEASAHLVQLADYQRLLEEANGRADTIRKYEADMAKLRKEIGEARVRDILAVAK